MSRRDGTGNAGYTLTELLVAMLLFTIAAAAAARLHASARTLYDLASHRGSLNERVQFAVGVLEPEIQMAGYLGSAPPPGAIDGPVPPSAQACGADFIAQLDRPVESLDGGHTLPCPPSGGGALPGSDVLILRRASTVATPDDRGRVQVISGPGRIERRDLIVRSYYVARSADGTARGSTPTPALRVKSLTSIAGRPAFVDTEVLPGIEDLQVELGYRDADDRLVFTAALPPDARAVAVRLWLLVRAEEPDPAQPPPAPMQYAGRTIQPEGRFHRLLVQRTFGVRNAAVL